jgi:hypothetical protein
MNLVFPRPHLATELNSFADVQDPSAVLINALQGLRRNRQAKSCGACEQGCDKDAGPHIVFFQVSTAIRLIQLVCREKRGTESALCCEESI